jgi:hypothetical protein
MSSERKPPLDTEARKKQLHALVDLADYFNSGLTQVTGRNDDGTLVSVAVLAEGKDAEELLRFLKRLGKKGQR